MTKVWSWEEMDYIGDDDEPRLLPDLFIPDGTTCASCGLTEQANGQRLVVLCSQCGRAAHYACAVDCNPDPYEDDEESSDFVCKTCLEHPPKEPFDDDALTDLTQLKSFDVPVDAGIDPFFDDELYPLP